MDLITLIAGLDDMIEMVLDLETTLLESKEEACIGRWKSSKEKSKNEHSTWLTNPAGRDIELNLEIMYKSYSDSDEEWEIFRILIKKEAEGLINQGWKL